MKYMALCLVMLGASPSAMADFSPSDESTQWANDVMTAIQAADIAYVQSNKVVTGKAFLFSAHAYVKIPVFIDFDKTVERPIFCNEKTGLSKTLTDKHPAYTMLTKLCQ